MAIALVNMEEGVSQVGEGVLAPMVGDFVLKCLFPIVVPQLERLQ